MVLFLSLFLSKQQQTIFLSCCLNFLSKPQYIVMFMLEFSTTNTSANALFKSVLGTKNREKLRHTVMKWQQKNRPTIAKTFLISRCSAFLETDWSVNSSIWLLVCLIFNKVRPFALINANIGAINLNAKLGIKISNFSILQFKCRLLTNQNTGRLIIVESTPITPMAWYYGNTGCGVFKKGYKIREVFG